jgi:hypothetical protein
VTELLFLLNVNIRTLVMLMRLLLQQRGCILVHLQHHVVGIIKNIRVRRGGKSEILQY